MILILHILVFENRKHIKFQFNWFSSFRDINFYYRETLGVKEVGPIAIVKKFDFDFLMIFDSTSLPQFKNMF